MPVHLTPQMGDAARETLKVSDENGVAHVDHEVFGGGNWERISVTQDARGTSVMLGQNNRQIDVELSTIGLTHGDVIRPTRNGSDINDIVAEDGSVTSWVGNSGHAKQVPTPAAQAAEDRALISGALEAGNDELAKAAKLHSQNGHVQTRVRPPKPF
jgi:hypothetical protein